MNNISERGYSGANVGDEFGLLLRVDPVLTGRTRGVLPGLVVGRDLVGAGVLTLTVGAGVGRDVCGNLQSVYKLLNVPPMARHAAV